MASFVQMFTDVASDALCSTQRCRRHTMLRKHVAKMFSN